MKVCGTGHIEIVHAEAECPLCRRNDELVVARMAIRNMEKKVAEMEKLAKEKK